MSNHAYPEAYFGPKDTSILSRERVLSRLAPYKRGFVAFIKGLPEGARVLDVGCGQGKAMKMILALRPDVKVVGMDISDVSAYLPKEVVFKRGALEDLGTLFEGETFDAVVCQHVIEHLVYPMQLMQGIGAVLKDGGRLFLETPNWTRLIAPFSHFYFYNDYTHVRPFSRTAMTRLLLDFGYQELSIQTVSSCSWFPPSVEKKQYDTEKTSDTAQRTQGLVARVLARLLNPLMRDVLIATAVRHEKS